MKKTLLILVLVIASVVSCEKEKEKVFSKVQFYGEWTDENSTTYYCSDGSGYTVWDSGEKSACTWYVADNKLYETYSGDANVYTILEMSTYAFKIQSESSGTVYHSLKQSDEGCYAPTSQTTGQGMFWTSEDFGCGTISISVSGSYVGTISSYISSGVPDCGESGFVTVTKTPGTYTWSAECSDYTWNGDITIEEGVCSTMQLTSKKRKMK